MIAMIRISTILSSLYLSVIVCLGSSISYGQSKTDNTLLHKFRDPPRKYRPEAYYHFLGETVTREGVAEDVEVLNNAGFSALQFFTVYSCSDIRNVMLTPLVPIFSQEWEGNLTTLAKGIQKSNTDLILHSCPGWATAGGSYEVFGGFWAYKPTCWSAAECAGQPNGDATCDGNINLADLNHRADIVFA
jgi:hypothetical protein